MNIFLYELRANLKSLLIWGASLAFIYYVASIEFSAFQGDPEIQAAMEQFEILFQALGTASSDMTTAEGYLSILSLYIFLPVTIFSGMLGANVISKEEKNKTAEFLFTLPVSRRYVLFNKLLAAIFLSLLLNGIVIGSILLSFGRFNPEPIFYTFLSNLSVGSFAIQMIFLGIGVMLSSILKQFRLSSAITVGILVSAFMLHMLIGFVEEIEFMKYATPFSYFSSELMMASDFQIANVLITLGLIIISFTTLFIAYPKRDLYI